MSLTSIPGLILSGIGLLSTLTIAFIVLKSTLTKTTSDLWKQEAEALGARLKTVEDSEHLCQKRLEAVEAANKVLSDQVTGATAIARLEAKMDKYHTDMVGILSGRSEQ